jgi:hypothetical protein
VKTGEVELSLPPFPPHLRTQIQWGYPPRAPSLLCSAWGLPSFFLCPHLLVEGMVRLSPRRVCGQIGIPWFAAGTLETLRKAVSMMKR